MENLGSILKVGRIKKGLSQQQVADILKVSKMSVSSWETGKTEPSASHLLKLVQMLDVAQELFGEDDNDMAKIKKRLDEIETKLKIKED